ncbi:hypothetical protein QWJ34_20645 [Saccharibacillus sp. CPCC 101409]|uniref:hypothetical protein n=1 Tax=Saccharibacillus sp. CPCC 101409 TaxID=3058041 RepID=UPI002673F9FF|nr:hypothetical protein [Saccharibacillus sp. CPCC 101409]MDO3412184.1 hypothetical protein [Saccharibacillus sp. CPCC 101409]
MQDLRCAYHRDRPARHQCRRCGRMLCDECCDPQLHVCKFGACAEEGAHSAPRFSDRGQRNPRDPYNGNRQGNAMNTGCRIALSILAVIGGLFLLLVAICGGMIFFNY